MKKFLAFLTALLMAVPSASGWGVSAEEVDLTPSNQVVAGEESSTPESEYRYTISKDGLVTINLYVGNDVNVVVPATIEGKRVFDIGERAFANCTNIESVEIPGTIDTIQPYAFSGCTGLKDVKLGEGVYYIREGAFEWCMSLKTFNLPTSTEYLEDYVFMACFDLETINVADGNFRYCSVDGVLFSRDKKRLIAFPPNRSTTYTVPAGVTKIEKAAFASNNIIESVSFSDEALTEIADEAFESCLALKSIVIPNSVTKIGDAAFTWCGSLETINVSDNLEELGSGALCGLYGLKQYLVSENCANFSVIDGVLFNKPGTSLYAVPGACSMTTYTVPSSVMFIKDFAFFSNTSLVEVTVTGNVMSVGEGAFAMCPELKKLVFEEGVKVLGESICLLSQKLEWVTFPSSIEVLPDPCVNENTVAHCKAGSYAESMMKQYNIKYVIDPDDPPKEPEMFADGFGYIGDIDDDGEFSAADSMMILRASIGINELSLQQITLCDVNGDEEIDSIDAIEVLRYSIGLVGDGVLIGEKVVFDKDV